MKCKICYGEFPYYIGVVNDNPCGLVQDENERIIEKIYDFDYYCIGCYERFVPKILHDVENSVHATR